MTVTFETTHYALWAEEVAGDAGIPVEVVPAPSGARARCSIALVTAPTELDRLTQALRSAGVPFELYSPER